MEAMTFTGGVVTLKEGDRIQFDGPSILADEHSFTMRGRFVKTVTHGFNLKGGGWALYGGGEGDVPAEFMVWIPKNKRKTKAFNLCHLIGSVLLLP